MYYITFIMNPLLSFKFFKDYSILLFTKIRSPRVKFTVTETVSETYLPSLGTRLAIYPLPPVSPLLRFFNRISLPLLLILNSPSRPIMAPKSGSFATFLILCRKHPPGTNLIPPASCILHPDSPPDPSSQPQITTNVSIQD